MDISTNDLLKEISELEEVKKIKVSTVTALKCGAIVGATTVIGGVLGGPIGLAIGGTVSSCIMGLKSRESLHSVPHIILHEMKQEDREKLAKLIINLSMKHGCTLRNFILDVQDSSDLQQAVIQILITFLTSELGMSICKV